VHKETVIGIAGRSEVHKEALIGIAFWPVCVQYKLCGKTFTYVRI